MTQASVSGAVEAEPRTRAVRPSLALGVVILAGLAGVQLFLLADSTATFFAWTVNPPIAAAFMGAAFWAVAIAAFVGVREAIWSQLAVLLPVATITTTLVLVATLLHLDRFHLDSPDLVPLIAAWVWLAVYIVVPPIFAAIWWLDIRRPDRPRIGLDARALSTPLRASFLVVGVLLALVATVLFVTPDTLPWPWRLTPLTSQMTGAFLAGVACTDIVMVVEPDVRNLRIAAIALLGFGILEGLALVRFSADVTGPPAAVAIWVICLAVTVILGAAALLTDRDARRRTRR